MTSGISYSPPPAFGRFKLLHQIGAGVLGPVFRTHDPDHERLVAVKAFSLDLTPEQASALAAEFERLTSLEIDDPCVAGPLAAGVEDFVPYVAVPYVPGESLDAAIRQYGPAPAGDAIRLIGHVADALDAAAHVGVFHGSLHPRDIIVTPGETHLTGIGVAQALERVGLHGPVRRPYVAPEREGGDEWGAAADIYSLAAIAYEVLTGRRALPGTDQPLPALADIRVHDAAALREAIESALDADPGRRPARARDFAVAFAAALSDSVSPGEPGERAADRRARKPRAKPQPPKLPGLDEPLQPQETALKGRSRMGAPVVPVPASVTPGDTPAPAALPQPEARTVAGPAATEPGAATGDIHYVPVTDPADAGEASERLKSLADSVPEAPPEPGPGPGAEAALPVAHAPFGAGVEAGPTPAAQGSNVFALGQAARSVFGEIAGAGAHVDPAGETQLTYRVGDHVRWRAQKADAAKRAEGRQAGDGHPLDRAGLEKPAASPDHGLEIDLKALDESLPPAVSVTPPSGPPSDDESMAPAEPLRGFARGQGAERRRTPPLAPGWSGEPDAVVPRAFEPALPAPSSRPVPDFELLRLPSTGRPPVFPVVIGVAAGLIVGLAAGYWLGSRNTPPVSAAPARAVTSVRPAPVAPTGAPTPARPAAPAATAAAPAGPAPSAPPPAASEGSSRPAAPPAAAARGTIQVTASQEANVYLDGERNGMTPRNLKNVPFGSHTIRVTRPGYAPQEQTVVLTAEEPSADLQFTLRPGGEAAAAGPAAAVAPAIKSVLTVLIESTPPGARIRIDGRDLAPTPLTVRQMRPGTHTIELRLPGYKVWSQRLTVAAGDDRRITATLERDTPR